MSKDPLPTAWPETVRQALDAIKTPGADVDNRPRSRLKNRHLSRVSALENALCLSIATHGMEGRR